MHLRSQDGNSTTTNGKPQRLALKSPVASKEVEKPKRLDETVEQKARPVRAIYFTHLTKWPGVAGAGMCLTTAQPTSMTAQVIHCDSIFLYRDEFVVNGAHFMPKTCGAILCWEF